MEPCGPDLGSHRCSGRRDGDTSRCQSHGAAHACAPSILLAQPIRGFGAGPEARRHLARIQWPTASSSKASGRRSFPKASLSGPADLGSGWRDRELLESDDAVGAGNRPLGAVRKAAQVERPFARGLDQVNDAAGLAVKVEQPHPCALSSK